ncbi:hypothetical protein EB821_04575 [Candidatus Marinimicrobia bacterium PRS2]|nr:hypothetical protein EB821_04575 [Candidatus Marinimicrobia bacterium PRS2]
MSVISSRALSVKAGGFFYPLIMHDTSCLIHYRKPKYLLLQIKSDLITHNTFRYFVVPPFFSTYLILISSQITANVSFPFSTIPLTLLI